jgi:PAS domain S-box-containing protein
VQSHQAAAAKESPMELAQSVAHAILAGAADAVVATDRDGNIRHWNPGAARIFGHDADEAIGRSLDLIIPERLRAAHWEGWRRVMETGESRYGQGDLLSVPGLRKDGQRISVEFTILTLKDEGGIIGMVALLRDVTKRFEEMKALRRKLADATGGSARNEASG